VFQNFNWDTTVRDKGNNIAKFKKLNILYGWNYSGKTSLSRIFRSLEKKRLPEKYANAIFEVNCDEAKVVFSVAIALLHSRQLIGRQFLPFESHVYLYRSVYR